MGVTIDPEHDTPAVLKDYGRQFKGVDFRTWSFLTGPQHEVNDILLDAFLLVLERKRRAGEEDRFFWYCEKCRAELYQAVRHVADYREDPVSRVYEEFYSEESHRTCGKCGHVTPRPAA